MKKINILTLIIFSIVMSSCNKCKHDHVQHTPNPSIREQVDHYRNNTPEKDRFLGPIRKDANDILKFKFDPNNEWPFMGKVRHSNSWNNTYTETQHATTQTNSRSPMHRKAASSGSGSARASASASGENAQAEAETETYSQNGSTYSYAKSHSSAMRKKK